MLINVGLVLGDIQKYSGKFPPPRHVQGETARLRASSRLLQYNYAVDDDDDDERHAVSIADLSPVRVKPLPSQKRLVE